MVHDTGQPRDILGNGNAFVFGLVREHRARNDIADRPYAGDGGREVMINLDLAALVNGEAGAIEREALGVRATADRHEDRIGLERFGGATG